MESPIARIVVGPQAIGINRLVHLARVVVVEGRKWSRVHTGETLPIKVKAFSMFSPARFISPAL